MNASLEILFMTVNIWKSYNVDCGWRREFKSFKVNDEGRREDVLKYHTPKILSFAPTTVQRQI